LLEIIFIHIPKTAGTTIFKLIERNYSPDEIIKFKKNIFKKYPDKEPASVLSEMIQPSTKVLIGHCNYRDLSLVLKQNPNVKLVTFLRDPVDRVISNFKFFRKRILTGKAKKKQLQRVHEPLMTYARRPGSINRMTKILKGVNLEDLYFIGIFETLENDIQELFLSLNLEIESIPHENKNSIIETSDITISSSDIQQLKSLNHQDILLYNKARQLRRHNPT